MMVEASGENRKLVALLNVLLPGADGFPAAGQAGVGDALMKQGANAALIETVLDGLGDDFTDAPLQQRIAAVSSLEEKSAAAFQQFLAAAYSAYYTAPSVLAVISASTGYQHPPQPGGYALAAFDESILEKVRRDPPSWRNTPSSNTEGSKP